MASRIRTFVAVDIDAPLRARVAALIERLRQSEAAVRWVAAANLHFSLKFLGDVELNEVHPVCQAVMRGAQGVAPFALSVRGLGAFPSSGRPRTLWLGVQEGSESLAELQAVVERELASEGYPVEARGFTPHLTLGRVRDAGRDQPELLAALQELADFEAGETLVSEVVVYSSQLGPGGPRYEVISTSPLGPA